MSPIVALLVGIPLGIAQSFFAWWVLFHYLAPKLTWEPPEVITSPLSTAEPQIGIRIRNAGRRRAIDIYVQAELRCPHPPSSDGVTQTIIRLPINTPWIPSIRDVARVRIEPERIPDSDWLRLRTRTGRDLRDIGGHLAMSRDAHLRFYAIAADAFSGSRMVIDSGRFFAADVREVATADEDEPAELQSSGPVVPPQIEAGSTTPAESVLSGEGTELRPPSR
jgi:hypothetical protein